MWLRALRRPSRAAEPFGIPFPGFILLVGLRWVWCWWFFFLRFALFVVTAAPGGLVGGAGLLQQASLWRGAVGEAPVAAGGGVAGVVPPGLGFGGRVFQAPAFRPL